jgi:hypothetical protein
MCRELFLYLIFLAAADAGGIVDVGEAEVYAYLQGKLQHLKEQRISGLPTMSFDHYTKLAKSSHMIRQTKPLDSGV